MSTDIWPLISPLTIDLNPPGHVPGPAPKPTSTAGLPHKIPPRRHPLGGGAAPDKATTVFPAHLFDRPNSVFVYGPSRPLVNLTLFALADATTPDFQWLDIGIPGEERTAFDPIRLGWVPAERLWQVEGPDALRPNELTTNLALFGLIRSDEPSETLTQLTEFLRLPETSQQILATRPTDGKPGALAVTNAHRVMAAFPLSRVPPILAVHRNAGFSVFVGFAEAPGPGRDLFDFVFRLDCEHVGDWRKGHLVCEKGIVSGPLRDVRPVALDMVPMLTDVLSRAIPSQ